MSSPSPLLVGRVASLWRYPVKSMLGEEVGRAEVGPAGLAGDRRYAVVDQHTKLVASAKSPRLWRPLLQARAESVTGDGARLLLPGGKTVATDEPDVDAVLSEWLGRPVSLEAEAEPGASLERAVPDPDADPEGLTPGEAPTIEIAGAAPPGTFFDLSPLQFVTTASLERAGSFHPAGKVDAVRYRPNIVIETSPGLDGFVENAWAGRQLRLGADVVLDVLIPSPRCVIPTLPHGELPKDPEALRVPLRHNFVDVPWNNFGSAPCLGAHAGVAHGGQLSAGDEVWLV